MARTLDIVITKITPRTVYYDLWVGGRSENWRVPPESTFDISALEVGKRYIVETRDIWIDHFNYRKQQTERVERYDWVTATIPAPKAKLAARTAKQREAAENMPPIANDDLFQW